MPRTPNPRVRADDPDVSVRELAGEFVVFDATRSKAHALNPSVAHVWRLCDGKRSMAEVAEELTAELGLEKADAHAILLMSLERLEQAGLLEDGWTAEQWEVPTRREALRAIAGVGAAALLPVVYSLIAPQAVQAQSGVICGQPCHPSQGITCGSGCVCSKPHGKGVCVPA